MSQSALDKKIFTHRFSIEFAFIRSKMRSLALWAHRTAAGSWQSQNWWLESARVERTCDKVYPARFASPAERPSAPLQVLPKQPILRCQRWCWQHRVNEVRTPVTLTDSLLVMQRTIVSTHPPPFVGCTPRLTMPDHYVRRGSCDPRTINYRSQPPGK